MRLVEAGEKTAFVNAKAVEYKDEKELQDLKDNPDVKTISTAQGKKIKEEVGRKYTAEESQAVGRTVGKSLIKVLRAQGDEVVDIRLTGIGVNKFGIKVKYGNDKGKDTFRFTLNPDTEDITLDLGRGDHQQLVDFIITQGNTVSLPTPELESKLGDAMRKYTSEPSDDEYAQMAAMEPESDPARMNKYIPEGDMNDPVAVKLKAAKMVKPTPAPTKTYSAKLNALQAERTRILADMEQEAELEGGPVADKYGAMLTRIDNAIAKIKSNSSQIDETIEENSATFKVGDKVTYLGAPGEITAAEDRYGKQYVSVAYNKGQGRTKVSGVLATNGDVEHAKSIEEKQLTKPELKKREDIVKAMKKQGEPKDARTYAIATAQAKKVAEDLDPVGKEDSDINNDGKVNSSDKYLANRRQAVSKNIGEDLDLGHEDDEPGMLLSDIYGIMQSAKSLYELVSQFEGHQEVDFPHWWQAKIVNAKANLSAARQYLDYEVNKPQIQAPVAVKVATLGEATIPGDVAALSKAQQSSTTIQSRSKNINNIGEFSGAFEEWMKTLGLTPGKASRGSIEAQVRKILTNLGYK